MNELTTIDVALRLLAATLFGGLIGYEREHRGRSAGLRTHMLVSLGSALVMLISMHLHFSFSPEENYDAGKIAAGIIAGIGFLGGGTIIKSRERAHGMTTAATIWTCAAMGMAVGCGFFSAAVITLVIVLVTLIPVKWLE